MGSFYPLRPAAALWRWGAIVVTALLCAPVAAGTDRRADPDYDRAVRAAQKWIAAHATEWNIAIPGNGPAQGFQRAKWDTAHCGPDTNHLVTASFQSAETTVELYFDCAVAQAKTLEALRAAYRFTVLGALPHGLKLPTWQFQLLTPVSSFSEGVDLAAWHDGILDVRIKTPLYALYGHSTVKACGYIADAPSPPRCFVHMEHRITLTLTFSARFSASVLQ